jgi:tetratricopeptide (TPR) repeat protein
MESVKAWAAPITLPTYEPLAPDRNPMFLETRVYQGSSGKVYPLPFIDRIATEPRERAWQAVHIENEFLRVMVLPEIGGRIHAGLDKTNGYDFFYRQNVIKPALVGLAGPWISGGVEFNWPQHHRPATFLPVNYKIEEHADGSRTIWLSDHDPMKRLRGMHGVCLYPGRAYLEVKVRLYNRTPFPQTFLWWANAAVHVNDDYQSFFPPDVAFVADHARRAMSAYPFCERRYYGVDYGRGAHPAGHPANDLSRYANIPVPTSYMAIGSAENFLGGYDHAKRAGVVHVANHHIAPGKKQWTWGNREFGRAWERNLTDYDGPYIELMAGVYTDNQPDFSFLAPWETRTFEQYWYPIQEIGAAQQANRNAAIGLRRDGAAIRVGVCVTQRFPGATVALDNNGKPIAAWTRDLTPGKALMEHLISSGEGLLRLSVKTADGVELIAYQLQPEPAGDPPHQATAGDPPHPASEPPLPQQIKTNDELYLTGLHLEQYRHATRAPEPYWEEALARDPQDARSNNALGLWLLRRGEFQDAERHLRQAIASLTRLNFNPYDGEAYYNLGLTLRYLDRREDAYAAFYKATWNYAWRAASFHALAELDAGRGDWTQALEHTKRCLRTNADDLNARNLAVLLLRRLERRAEADEMLAETLQLDPLDPWAGHLADGTFAADEQTRLDVAFDYMRAGFYQDACRLIETAEAPMPLYVRAFCEARLGRSANEWLRRAANASPDYCFPSRLEEMLVLQFAIDANPRDARARYYLGNLLYDRRRHREAIAHWEQSAALDAAFSVVWRNLGIGYFNIDRNSGKAWEAFEKARAANPSDARLLYEQDQLAKRTGAAPKARLERLEQHAALVNQRDDLSVELASLYNQTEQSERALRTMQSRQFQPWEGGEGLAIAQHVRAHLALGRRALSKGDPLEATKQFEAALENPPGAGEAKHPLANQSNIYYWLGMGWEASGEDERARGWWRKAAREPEDISEMTYYSALALRRLGKEDQCARLLRKLLAHARELSRKPPTIDYFATSLPTMLLFREDLEANKRVTSIFLEAQGRFGLGDKKRARPLLNRVLKLDPHHAMAMDLRDEVFCEQPASIEARV